MDVPVLPAVCSVFISAERMTTIRIHVDLMAVMNRHVSEIEMNIRYL